VTIPHCLNHRTNSIWSRLTRCWRIVSIIVVAGVLAGCADEPADTEDRRFANQPSTENVSLATPAHQGRVVALPTPLPQASPEALLNVEGAPGVIFTLIDGSIVAVDTTGSDPAVRIPPPDAQRFVAIAPSPIDNQVAAIFMSVDADANDQIVVELYDSHGQVLTRWRGLPAGANQQATPATGSDQGSLPVSISWAPRGDRLLLSTGGPELVRLDRNGGTSLVTVPSPVRHVVNAAWSPNGDQIALLARNEEGSGAIWVFSPYVDGVSMRQVAPLNADAANIGSVTRFAWLPDGTSLAYILAERGGVNAQGGQLYTINLRAGIKLLLATPGRGGPAAEIVDFSVTPDGRAVAYAIAIPDGDRWQFHSLWIRSISSPGAFNVPVGNVERIDNLWWALSGLVWQQQTGDATVVVAQAAGSEPQPILTLVPGATPEAATPISATPMVATPAGATPAPATPSG